MEKIDSSINSTDATEKWKFINSTCRLCSLECQSKSRNILQKNILEMVELCSSLRPNEADGFPTRICTSCFQTLNICFVFRKKIEASDGLLKKKLRSFLPKQDILDIALNKAEIKSLQTKINCKRNSEDLSDEVFTTSRQNSVEDIFDYSCTLTQDENKMEAPILKKNGIDIGKTKEVIYNVALPPLVPIEPKENMGKKSSTQTLPQDPPPLVPLKTSPNEDISSKIVSLESTEITCCEKNLSQNQLKTNIEIYEPSKPLFCNICKKEYKEGKKLIGHLKGHMVPKNFVCKICGKKYPNPSTFQIHMRSHTGERPFKCPICNKGFTRWAGVVSHMQTHEDNRPFKCDSCDQSFKIFSNLERHKVLHAGVLPFCCNYCGKTFSQSANLQLHIRTYHTNERPYLCSECGKGFVSSTRLNRHMWVHTGYKPFHCKICSKAYSNSGDLKNHESTAHGNRESEKPFACNLCDKRFFYSCRLNKHFKAHQRTHTCNQCRKTFRSSSILDQHMESKHSVVPLTNTFEEPK